MKRLGYGCVDGDIDGSVGANVSAYVDLRTMQPGLWPVREAITNYTEAQLFDMVEFMFDHVSKPVEGWQHTFCDCGWHWKTFSSVDGRAAYRECVNPLLESYSSGFTLNGKGEITHHAPHGMNKLLTAQLPSGDETVNSKVRKAVDRFQRYGTTIDERANAVRDLADVLEWLRPQIKTTLLHDDENELFNLANKFGIRHMNQNQRVQYDRNIWLSWMFYHYLATINACLHLLGKQEAKALPAAAN